MRPPSRRAPAARSLGIGPRTVIVGHSLVHTALPAREYASREYGLTLLLSGVTELRMDGHAIPPERPLMWLVPVGTACYERCDAHFESWWAAFRCPGLTIRKRGLELELGDGRSTQRIPRWKRPDAAAAARMVEIYRRLKGGSERHGLAAAAENASLLLELLTRFLALPALGGEPAGHRALERFRALLEEHAAADRRIADLAREAGGSADHLGTLFRRHFGARPVDYRNGLRLSRARELLAAGGMKVKDAAHAVGFSDQLYFSRLFRRRYGLSPSEVGRGAGPP